MALSDNVCFVCLCTQAVDPDGSELDIYQQEDVAEDLFAEGETEGSDEELGVHAVSPTASHEGRAELDHLDSRDAFAVDMSEQEVEVEEDTGNVSEDRVVETSSDEEEEEEIAEPVQPRRRLRGKQPAPQYGPPPQPAADNPEPGPSGTAPSSSAVRVIKRPAMLKRPSGRAVRPNEECRGFGGEACQFCPNEPGKPARVQAHQGRRHCIFCKKETMEESRGRGGRGVLTTALKKFLLGNRSVFEAAHQRVQAFLGEDTAQWYARQAAGKEPPKTWQELLQSRQQSMQPMKPKEAEEYQNLVRRDQRVARRKLFFPEKLLSRASEEVEKAEKEEVVAACGPLGHVAPNDTDLPRPSTATGKMMEDYCKFGSWGLCEKCHSICPRPLQPTDLRNVKKPTLPPNQCTTCRHGEYVPQPGDVPKPLQGLKPRVLEALRPLEMDIGKVERVPHGYRVHSAVMAFAWKPKGVATAVEDLPKKKDRKAGRAALEFLLGSTDSGYTDILQQHEHFLDKNGLNADMKARKRPLRFIETEGLECALWPHLYWHRNLCETVARASHEARRGARDLPRRVADSDGSGEEPVEAEEEEGGQAAAAILAGEHGRIKRGFLRKVLSPLIGYGTDYNLLHFVFDLSMWTTIGTKKNLAARSGVALRHLLKGSPWTPEYWRVRHQAVLDMQRQCGNASLFRTRAPYERTFPYHVWVMHEQAIAGRPRMHLAGAETLHMAHILMQLDSGYICGDKAYAGRGDRVWSGHVLGPADQALQISTVVSHVTRLEFQDGKRKLASQKYHGRGTVHSHSLDFLENMEQIGLETKVLATIPCKETEPFLHALVLDSQPDRKDSKLPVREEPSEWNPETGTVELQQPTMEVTKCHEDIQQGGGTGSRNGAILRYVATYDMKFSSSVDTEWLSGGGSDYSAAVGVLRRLRVLEPEMWLTLAQERFPQARLSGSIHDIMAPTFSVDKKPKFVELYESCGWRSEDMTLLEFLRKSNKDGEIIRYLQQKHVNQVMQEVQNRTKEDDKTFTKHRQQLLSAWNKHKKEKKDEDEVPLSFTDFLAGEGKECYQDLMSLEAFANAYQTRGEKLIAVTTHSMLNDKFFAQWLILRKPFRRMEEFQEACPTVLEKVNEKYVNFALCLAHAPEMWENDAAIEAAMELEANSKAFIETILNKVRAQRHIVARYLAGELQPSDAVESSQDSAEAVVRQDGHVEKKSLTRSQKRLKKAIGQQMEISMAACRATTDADLEVYVEEANQHKILFASGPPGTGKTHVLHEQVRRWKQEGARILFALPTGQLSSELRAVHPDVDMDTYHGAFLLHRPLQEAMAILTQYELVVIDEASQDGRTQTHGISCAR